MGIEIKKDTFIYADSKLYICMGEWSSGLRRSPYMAEIEGSNPSLPTCAEHHIKLLV